MGLVGGSCRSWKLLRQPRDLEVPAEGDLARVEEGWLHVAIIEVLGAGPDSRPGRVAYQEDPE